MRDQLSLPEIIQETINTLFFTLLPSYLLSLELESETLSGLSQPAYNFDLKLPKLPLFNFRKDSDPSFAELWAPLPDSMYYISLLFTWFISFLETNHWKRSLKFFEAQLVNFCNVYPCIRFSTARIDCGRWI